MVVYPYQDTEVSFTRSMQSINKLLDKWNCNQKRWTELDEFFMVEFNIQYTNPEDGKFVNATARIVVDLKLPEDFLVRLNRAARLHRYKKTMARGLFYYLKSKFESLAFGFVDILEEFMPYLLVPGDGPDGMVTVREVAIPRYKEALESGKMPTAGLMGLTKRQLLGIGEGDS